MCNYVCVNLHRKEIIRRFLLIVLYLPLHQIYGRVSDVYVYCYKTYIDGPLILTLCVVISLTRLHVFEVLSEVHTVSRDYIFSHSAILRY